MTKRFLSALFVAAALSAMPASAQSESVDREAAAEQIQQRVEETAARLNLTDEQKPEVEAIIRDSAEKRQAVLESFGFKDGNRPKMNPRKMRSMRGQMNEIADETTEKLSAVLTDAQMAEYEQIKEEQRAAMRERIKNR